VNDLGVAPESGTLNVSRSVVHPFTLLRLQLLKLLEKCTTGHKVEHCVRITAWGLYGNSVLPDVGFSASINLALDY